MQLPRIAITMGDPAGIGPEIALHTLGDPLVRTHCVPVVLGQWNVLERVAAACGLPAPDAHAMRVAEDQDLRYIERPAVIDLSVSEEHMVQPGQFNASTGRASLTFVQCAIDAALAGSVSAIATGPIQKAAWSAAGISYAGHTDLLSIRTGVRRCCMMLTCDEVTCSLVTDHVGLGDVPALLNPQRILDVIELSNDAMIRLRGRPAHIVVCGLNPHSGEQGLFGDSEEEKQILPAILAARQKGLRVEGPLSPDTAFLPKRRRQTDCYVCMYHDQGLIPLKALAFDVAVNVTLGLPIIRTSVDHGTALDIAWQGTADPTSMRQAVLMASKLARTSNLTPPRFTEVTPA